MYSSSSERSSGDGMEDLNLSLNELKSKSQQSSLMKNEHSIKNTVPYVDIPIPIKQKEPKFIPYEPYKAAVTPIIPEQKNIRGEKHTNKKNHGEAKLTLTETHIPFPLTYPNIPIHEKLQNNGETVPLLKVLKEVKICKDDVEDREELLWKTEKNAMKEEINKLKEEKCQLQDQFKIQLQVNAELKKLLVASLGEDMQTRVQFLSEDKAKLAQDIAHYSQLLLEDHEELERLSIQCDIWRSKFLAISLMVDELASWKATLSHKYEESLNAIQWMLTEQEELHHQVSTVYNQLQQLQQTFDPSTQKKSQKIMNILQIAQAARQLSELLYVRLLGSSKAKSSMVGETGKKNLSPAEAFAQKVLTGKDLNRIHGGSENELSKDGQTPLYFSNKLYHHYPCGQNKFSNSAWCRHCSGEIKIL
ncbi:golgin-45-like [Centruroides sculpturatus]|uniref:golgin-45-like n=1 Tax=Centruroides sculpturatus TaxID=218467 RepID=UPI000C6C8F34|nr:golgin-45-like [Centruroides sculpturatus]